MEENQLYKIVNGIIPPQVLGVKNKASTWTYGYNKDYDIVVISKNGTIGDIYEINGLRIALPGTPKEVENNKSRWKVHEYPKELSRIKTIQEWNLHPEEFQNEWVDYIDGEFEKREQGHWFVNKYVKTYITGTHYMYLQWSKIDIGLPDFRESNRIFWIFWEACKADNRSYGMCYLKNRRSGFSFMSSAEIVNIGTLSRNSKLGILSKTAPDAKSMFTDKVVPISRHYPFFFKPVQDGMDNPKTELSYRLPARKITRKSMKLVSEEEEIEGLDTSIDWRATADNSYDGEKLIMLIEDEAGKLEKPNNILNGWRVRQTCLRLGNKIIGKCMMGSTSNALSKGGANYKKMFNDSDPLERSANGRTKSGLYSLFIPMEHNYEGFIDEFGHAVLEDPKTPVMGIDGEPIEMGVITFWNNEVASLRKDPDALNEFYRQNPRTPDHAFRDESKESIFNLTKIYDQVGYNDNIVKQHVLTTGNFTWKDGIQDSEVVWTPDVRGRFTVSWIPPIGLRNRFKDKSGRKLPLNEHVGAFGCDPYDITGTVGGGGSKGALHGKTKFHLDDAPVNEFFLEYVARPAMVEIFFEDVLMACAFYGMQVLVESNKHRLLYHLKNRGYRAFSMNRPDKPKHKLSVTEKELGGIPSASEDVIHAHAGGIETYIEKYVGLDTEGTYRESDDMGAMYFNHTLQDWAAYDIKNRTKFDATISSGLAIMATNRHTFIVEKPKPKLIVNFAKYDNTGSQSEIKK